MIKKSFWKKFVIYFVCFLLYQNIFATTIRFAEFSPNRGLRAEALKNFAKKLEQRSKGELKIQFFWAGSLLKTNSILKGVGQRVADMGSVVGFLSPKELRYYAIGDLPLQNSNEWVGMRALYELVQQSPILQQEFQNSSVVYLTNFTTGPIQLICKKELQKITDFNGKKIRASGAYSRVFSSLGASIQKLSQPSVYQALQTGLVDCNQNYYYSIKAYKQYEASQNLLELDWGQNMSFGIVVNRSFFQKLSITQQQILRELGSEFIDDFAKSMIEDKNKIKLELQNGIDNYKLKIQKLSPKDQQILQQKGDLEIQKWVEKNGKQAEILLQDYQKLIQKYQKLYPL